MIDAHIEDFDPGELKICIGKVMQDQDFSVILSGLT